jgi:predicted metal-dependent hydrolase
MLTVTRSVFAGSTGRLSTNSSNALKRNFWGEGHYESRLGLNEISIETREIDAQWGEYEDGTVRPNWRLILAPVRIQDDVIVHELAYSVHEECSESFWNTVGALIHEHEERRE